MQTHILEPPETRTPTTERVPLGAALTKVGTFASGQSEHGAFRVVAEADLGSFADGVTDESPTESA
jgi:hypothetical protein